MLKIVTDIFCASVKKRHRKPYTIQPNQPVDYILRIALVPVIACVAFFMLGFQ
jgi:hypothetical protein